MSADPREDPQAEPPATALPTQSPKVRYVRMQPHRGNTILGMGIAGVMMAVFGGMMALTLYFCCPLWLIPLGSLGLSIPAWTMGHADLIAMRERRMDPSGKDITTIGMICGIIGVALIATGALVIIMIVVIYAIIIAIAAASEM